MILRQLENLSSFIISRLKLNIYDADVSVLIADPEGKLERKKKEAIK